MPVRIVVLASVAASLCAGGPIVAQEAMPQAENVIVEEDAAEAAFSRLTALAGQWDVEGVDQLTIAFELTAGGSVLVERWMVGERMHSMTVYQREAATILATHYCPQGNAPRLVSQGDDLADLHFRFREAVDLDPESEEWVYDLWIQDGADQVRRGETYRNARESGEETVLKLTRRV